MSVQILSYSSAIRACALALLLVTLSSVATARRLSRRLQEDTVPDQFAEVRLKIVQEQQREFSEFVSVLTDAAGAPGEAPTVSPDQFAFTGCPLLDPPYPSCENLISTSSGCDSIFEIYASCMTKTDIAAICPNLVTAYQNCAVPPPSPPPPPPPLGGGNCEDVSGLMYRHNAARANLGVFGLVWNEGVAQEAQAWADTCHIEHSGNTVSENIGWGPAMGCNLSADMWIAEGSSGGHHKNIVNPNYTQFGCGVANCGNESFVVCHYTL